MIIEKVSTYKLSSDVELVIKDLAYHTVYLSKFVSNIDIFIKILVFVS